MNFILWKIIVSSFLYWCLRDHQLQSMQLHQIRGCSQMTSAFLRVSDTPWCLCQPIISFWPAPWCFKLTTSFVNCPEPVVGARVCTQMTIIENSQSTIHLLQKGTSWAYWDPLRPSLDGFHRIVGFFVIHQLFLWPLIPLVSFCQLFKSPLVVQCCNVICEWPLIQCMQITHSPVSWERQQEH